jgi:hypothetical protein
MSGLPVAIWVILFAAALFVGEYVWLRMRHAQHRATGDVAERRLVAFATALRNYAKDNLQRLPDSLDELNLPGAEAIAYRPIPRLNLDEKLVLVHDASPLHQVIEFPALREGRGVIFCSGRLHIVSEDVFDKLIAADDGLRERLGLESV